MNKNKGVIGIGLIIAIVLGVAVVGGGAYYLGKNENKPEVKVEESNLSVEQNSNKIGILSYKTPCEIASISKQSFSFSYPEGYTIKEIKPAEGNVPLSGVMQTTIQPKDGGEPIMIGPSFETCESTGIKLCKNIDGVYRLSTINNSSEVELAYNQILSTIKSGTDCKDSSGDLVPINSSTVSISKQCVDISTSLFSSYINKFNDIEEYKLNDIKFSFSNSNINDQQYFYKGDTKDACIVHVNYSVKPKKDAYNKWTAGNGNEGSDGWILNKSGVLTIDRNNTSWFVARIGTGI